MEIRFSRRHGRGRVETRVCALACIGKPVHFDEEGRYLIICASGEPRARLELYFSGSLDWKAADEDVGRPRGNPIFRGPRQRTRRRRRAETAIERQPRGAFSQTDDAPTAARRSAVASRSAGLTGKQADVRGAAMSTGSAVVPVGEREARADR